MATLAKHTLALDALADCVRMIKASCSKSGKRQAVQGKAKGKGSGHGAQRGIQKSDANAKPEHADVGIRLVNVPLGQPPCPLLCPAHPNSFQI